MSLPQPPTSPITQVCYRHPQREAGRQCTRCGKPACSDCLVQVSVGSHCVDCIKAAKPDIKTKAKYWNAGQHSLVTFSLIAANVAVFILLVVIDSRALGGNVTRGTADLGLNKSLLRNGARYGDHIYPPHQWFRLLTSGFIHFGIFHLAMNMFALYQLGQMLERSMGRSRFALLYFAGLFGGSLGSLLLERSPGSISGGASGAIFALLAAAAVGLQRQGVNVMRTSIGSTLAINLLITFAIPFISIGGHLGGAAAGAICGLVLLAPHWKPMPKWAHYATPLALIAISVLGSVLVVGSA